jgi:hypothetical protein
VPHNRFLLLKYNGHINDEVCTSLKAVKYIYKYIYKGFDCANIVMGNGDNQRIIHDEIATYLDARYVSAPETMWWLLESPMHDRSHAVIRLPVHLHQQQRITFKFGNEQEAINRAKSGSTKLTTWFKLNRDDQTANQLMYIEIPLNHVYKRNSWIKRQRGRNNIVPRMYTVGLNDQERFYLRLFLLHVPGATSYEYLRTVDGIEYATFKESAFHRNLLDTVEEKDRLLHSFAFIACPLIHHIYGKLFVST